MGSAPGVQKFNHVVLFPFALTLSFCCMILGWLLVCHVYNCVITCNWLYLLAVPQMGFILTTLMLLYVGNFLCCSHIFVYHCRLVSRLNWCDGGFPFICFSVVDIIWFLIQTFCVLLHCMCFVMDSLLVFIFVIDLLKS